MSTFDFALDGHLFNFIFLMMLGHTFDLLIQDPSDIFAALCEFSGLVDVKVFHFEPLLYFC